MDYKILVNKENMLDRDYVPENLVEYTEYNGEKLDINHKTMLEKETLNAFFEMKSDAMLKNYNLIVDSGYRSYDYQLKILETRLKEEGNLAYNYVALPGASEHQTGLAFDIAFLRNGKYIDDFDDTFPEII